MNGLLIRVVLFVVIAGAIYFGLRRIWRDWTGLFRREDKALREHDRRARDQPGVVTLSRDADGTFRPPDGRAGNDN